MNMQILIWFSYFIVQDFVRGGLRKRFFEDEDFSIIEVFDLTYPTTWKELSDYYNAIEKHWKICVNCGIPGLGTGIHIGHTGSSGMQPAIIPSEYLLTRLAVIDLTYMTMTNPDLVLTLDVALQWSALKHDPREPTLVLFKFGWKDTNPQRKCVCSIPGLSYDLASWIAVNLSHVVGVATDAPTLESDQTREMTSRTVSNVLARSGVYIIENVNLRKRLPERGCMTIAMPLMMLQASYVPTRLTAYCSKQHTTHKVCMALKKNPQMVTKTRINEIDLDDILN